MSETDRYMAELQDIKSALSVRAPLKPQPTLRAAIASKLSGEGGTGGGAILVAAGAILAAIVALPEEQRFVLRYMVEHPWPFVALAGIYALSKTAVCVVRTWKGEEP